MRTHVSALHDDISSRAALADPQFATGGAADATKITQASAFDSSRGKLQEMRDDAVTLEQYGDGPGAEIRESFNVAFPNAPVEELTPVPTEVGIAFSSNFGSEARGKSIASLVAHYNLNYGHQQKVPQQVESAWVDANLCLMDHDSAQPNEDVTKCPCNDAGCCLCTRMGRRWKAMNTNLHKQCTKPFAQPHAPGRVQLKEGRWAYIFVGLPRASQTGDPDPAAPAPQEIVLHASAQCLSPWETIWQELRRCAAPPGEPPETDARVYTRVLNWEY